MTHIAVIGKFYPEAFGRHIAETLERMGHRVTRCEIGYRAGRFVQRCGALAQKISATLHAQSDQVPAIRQRRFRRLLDALDVGAPLDLVLETHDFLWPEEVAEVKRRSGAAFAVWFPDALMNLPKGYLLNAPIDALFFKDPFLVRTLGQVTSGRCFYLPECQNPIEHERSDDLSESMLASYRCDVATAGNLHSYRAAVFAELREFDVMIWGHPAPLWLSGTPANAMYAGRPVVGQEKVSAFAAARIVLNNLHFSEVWGINARAFEAAAAGAFQLIDWRPGLAQLFEDGRELISFRDAQDMKTKIRHYLKDHEARQRIGAAGLARARRDHRYDQRLQLLLDTVAGRERGFPMPHIAYV